MNAKQSTTIRARAGRARFGGLIAAAIAATFLFGCSGRTGPELAADDLASGLAAQASGDLTVASAAYLSCVAHETLNSYCLYNLGLIAQTGNRLAEAENDYRLALVSNPTLSAAIFNLAIIRAAAGAPLEAISLYRHYIEINPTIASGFLNLGLLLRSTGDIVNAQIALAQARLLDSTLRIPAESPAPSSTPRVTAAPSPSTAIESPAMVPGPPPVASPLN
jgi:tetratricopeptide (TPR) repeat protein